MQSKKNGRDYKVKVGENIRSWREVKKLKQADLAKRVEISAEALSNIENGISKPNIERLEDIADALEIEFNHLFINPEQLIALNQSNHTNQLYSSHYQHNFDKNLMDRMVQLMEKMTEFFTARNQKI